MKLYEALALAFKKEKTNTCFALLGDANMHWAGAMAVGGVHCVYTRHEHAAVAAATAYARTTGEVGVASVTCGPGLTQTMTILPIAVRARIPLVIFAREAPISKIWYNQGIEQRPFVEACGATYRSLHDPSTMIADVHQAFADAKKAHQPVVIGVPFDLQQQEWNHKTEHLTSVDLLTYPPPIKPEESDIQKAAKWIAASDRPVVLAGLGAVSEEARAACIALATKCGACLATTLPAKGLFHDQSFCLGVAGGYATERAKEVFAESDLVVAVGSRLASHTFDGGKLTPNARVIHIDIDPQETVQGRKASQLQITSDALLALDALIHTVSPRTAWRSSDMLNRTDAALLLEDGGETGDSLLHPMDVVKKLSEIIPQHAHLVNTSGHCAYYTAQMNHHPQSHYTVIRDFGAIGNGTSFAMGIAAAHPNRPVVLLDGDGSLLMNIQELETMQRHKLHVLVVVLNDGAYGSEVHKLRADGVTDEGSVFGRSDLSGVARGFGLVGRTFTDTQSLEESMDEFLACKKPTLWDIHISDKVASPQILKAHHAATKL